MNTLKIKLNPYKEVNIVSLDEKALSPYSELNNYMKEPFLKWADKLLSAAEREINDDYELVVVGEQFETLFIKDMQNDYDACQSYTNEPYQISNTVDERFDLIKQLAIKYGIQVMVNEFRLPVYSDVDLSASETMVNKVNLSEATLVVSDNAELESQLVANNGPVIFVLLSDHSKVTSLGEMKYRWEIESNRLNEVVGIIIDRFVKIPIILDVAQKLKGLPSKLSEDDSQMLSMATEIDMFISIGDIPELEVGGSYDLVIKTVPASDNIPSIRIESSNNSIIAVDGFTINAVAPGNAYIDIYKSDELMPFARKEIKTTQHNLVKEIRLSLPSAVMAIGQTQKIGITLIPSDGDDISELKWNTSNGSVIQVDNNGEIKSLNSGSATITASTSKVTQEVEIEVLPNIQGISLSAERFELYVGQTLPVEVTVVPNNAYDKSYAWKSSDNSIAVVERLDDGKQVVRATGIGECVLTCVAKEGGCTATCTVKVESTFKKRENIHTFLNYETIAAVASFVCAILGFELGVIIAAAATFLFGIIAIGKNKKDIVWAIVFMAASVFMYLLCKGLV